MDLRMWTEYATTKQLVNDVKGTYAGLVMVEKKCVEIDQQQASATTKLPNEQWQALIALHRTLLHEHHDFFLDSQHPSSSPALRRLAIQYTMPARMWRLEFIAS
jgi:polyribonucleotide nucleotidyltransferase